MGPVEMCSVRAAAKGEGDVGSLALIDRNLIEFSALAAGSPSIETTEEFRMKIDRLAIARLEKNSLSTSVEVRIMLIDASPS